MLVQYELFYRVFGVRSVAKLTMPPVPTIDKYEIPRDSIYHYIGTGPLDSGPTESELALDKNKKLFPVKIITELTSNIGIPRRAPIDVNRAIQQYRVQNKRFKLMSSLEIAQRDRDTVVVYNYALLHRMYRYTRNAYTQNYVWTNIITTMFNSIADIAAVSTRHHFVEFTLPKIIPSVSFLNTAAKILDTKMARVFNAPETIFILELWKWLSKDKGTCALARINRGNADKVNIVIKDGTRWSVINLGLLLSWKQPTEQELEEFPTLKNIGMQSGMMQKQLLRYTMAITNARNAEVDENLGDVTKVYEDVEPVTEEPVLNKDEIDDDANSQSNGDSDELINNDLDIAETNDSQVMTGEEEDDDLKALEEINHKAIEAPVNDETSSPFKTGEVIDATPIFDASTPEEAIKHHLENLATSGAITANEYRRYTAEAGAYKRIEIPNEIIKGGANLGDFIQIPKQLTEVSSQQVTANTDTIIDKTMLKSSLVEFDSKYVKEVMQRDIASMAVSLQNAGIIVQDFNIDKSEDITGTYHSYEIKVKPLVGNSSTLRFKIPAINEDGTFTVNGVNYRSRKQRGDVPIRKINPARVALTSYYGKVFVDRSQKKVNDHSKWLQNKIMAMGLDNNNDIVTNIQPGDCFDNQFIAPKIYTTIAMAFRNVNVRVNFNGVNDEAKFIFDCSKRYQLLDSTEDVELAKKRTLEFEKEFNCIVCGQLGSKLIVVNKTKDEFYISNVVEGKQVLTPIPDFETLLGIKTPKSPIEYAEVSIFGKAIPLGVILGYYMGLSNLVKYLKVTPRIIPAGTRPVLTEDEWAIVFLDETWVFSRDDTLATLVLAGWRDYNDTTSMYGSHEFDRKDVYFNALEDQGLSGRYLREVDLLNQMFVDPITKEILTEMKEPVVFWKLLLRAGHLLTLDQHPDELDNNFMRIKGYERFAGHLYTELVKAVRIHNSKSNKAVSGIELNPYAVWIAINEDPTKTQCVEINPIQELKEQEAVTYAGTGGRMRRSMVRRTRAYHPSDMGVISEATVDSSDVAINTLLSADPQFTSVRGLAKPYVIGKTGPTALFSTSALLSPAADKDDGKRVNFISIQHGHGIACDGYTQAQVRTGYEQVIPHRTSDLYCHTAKKSGTVESVNEYGIIVVFDDGEKLGIKLGKRYGAAAGLTIPHTIVTTLKTGEKFEAGDALAYNNGFFEPDVLNPKQIIWKSSVLVKTVLLESTDTLEDSCAISSRMAKKMSTKTSKVRTIVLSFNNKVHKLVKPGELLTYESILCIIEDEVTASSGVLDEESIDTLRALSSLSPIAKFDGVVDKIEVFYNGETEDMTESLQAIVAESDKLLTKKNKSIGKTALTGRVDESFRIDGDPLQLDTLAIQVYITADTPAAVGDKFVFANQMKSVAGRVFYSDVMTESGVLIDAIFGAKSIDDRIVISPFEIGTTTTLLNVIASHVVNAYEKE